MVAHICLIIKGKYGSSIGLVIKRMGTKIGIVLKGEYGSTN